MIDLEQQPTNKIPITNNLKAKKRPSIKLLIGGVLLMLLVLGSASALYLTQMNQDVRQQASEAPYCGDGICQNPSDPCQCLADCGSLVTAGQCGTQPPTDGGCVGNNCSAPPGGCIAVHHCDELFVGGSGGTECTVLTPDLKPAGSSVNAQDEANRTCKCVQVDVLNGDTNSCGNGHINEDWSTLIGAAIACPDASANCGPTNPTPTPNPDPTPDVTPDPSPVVSPSPSPITYFCNSDCTDDRQCLTAGNGFACVNNKCRMASNPTDVDCRPPVGPMCLDIDLVDGQSGEALTEDPAFGDTVKFTCAEVANVDHYIFRVIAPDGTITNLTATGRTSEMFTISQSGEYFAQCQICTTENDLSCLGYEAL